MDTGSIFEKLRFVLRDGSLVGRGMLSPETGISHTACLFRACFGER